MADMTNLARKIDESKPFYGTDRYIPRQSNPGDRFFICCPRPATASTDTQVIFNKLANEWKKETAHLSLVSKRLQHPAYKQILGMGRGVVPLIIEEMEKRPDHWFYALAYLTDENPVPHNFTGTVQDAVDLWVRWGHKRYAS